MAKINCSVNSCTYWGKGEVCKADSIMVKNNQSMGYDMEIGTMGENDAGTSAETMCETYKPKAEYGKES